MRVVCDEVENASLRGGDVNDHPLHSTAWLANHLSGMGEQMMPGQIVLTGSYTTLLPLQAGQSWRASMGRGTVNLTTASTRG